MLIAIDGAIRATDTPAASHTFSVRRSEAALRSSKSSNTRVIARTHCGALGFGQQVGADEAD